MKTAMQQMIEEIDNQQKRYIELVKNDKKLSKGVDAILTATTLLKMKAKEFLEAEKEQITEAYEAGHVDGYELGKHYEDEIYPNSSYYTQTFKSDE